MNDGVLVNDGSYYHEDNEQKLDKRKEKGQAVEGTKLIEELIEHFDERITYHRSIDSITETADPAKFMHQVFANKLTVANLEDERTYLTTLLDQYK
jgi:hypothetical protein